eukprot:12885611-Prorocentrum_lima.AAC.1
MNRGGQHLGVAGVLVDETCMATVISCSPPSARAVRVSQKVSSMGSSAQAVSKLLKVAPIVPMRACVP